MIRRVTLVLCAITLLGALPGAALAQKSVADVLGRGATPEGKPKSYLEEITSPTSGGQAAATSTSCVSTTTTTAGRSTPPS